MVEDLFHQRREKEGHIGDLEARIERAHAENAEQVDNMVFFGLPL